MKQPVAVIGMGRLGKYIIRELINEGVEVTAIDKNEKALEDIKDIVTNSFILDATDIDALKEINISSYKPVIIAMGGSFEATLLTAYNCQLLNVERIIVRANNEIQETILKKIGITEVINPLKEIASEIVEVALHPGVSDVTELATSIEVATYLAPPSFFNQKIGTIKQLFHDQNIFFITIRRRNSDGTHYVFPPKSLSDYMSIKPGDELVLLGDKEKIYKIMENP